MNVGYVCKQIPAYMPHELLGYPTDSVEGMLLTQAILSKINIEEQQASKEQNAKQSGRVNKFKNNR